MYHKSLLMKKSLLLFAMVLVAGFASAQYYTVNYINAGQNPGNLNQDEEQPSSYMTANYTGYTEILAPSSTGWSATQTLPFAFEFNGGSVSTYQVAAAGVVSFAANVGTAPSTSNNSLPSTSIPDSSICAWGLNLSGSNDAVITKTFGTAPNRQQWVIWASASAAGLSGTNWAYWGIVMEETTNKMYVVDMRTYSSGGGNVSLTVGLQIDGSTAFEIGSSVQSQNTATGGSSLLTDNTYYAFNPGVQPTNDLENVSVDNGPYQEVNTSGDIVGTVRNLGSAAVTTFEISYSVDGGSAVTGSITGVNIASGATYSYTHPTSWTPTIEQTSTITTNIVSVNSASDEDNTNDEASTDVLVHPTPVTRKPILEQFTSSTCPPCTPGNANVLSVMSNYSGEYSKVNYQMSWPGAGDPYFTLEGQDRRTFYAVNSVPSMHTDGSLGLNSNSYTAAVFEAAQDVPAFVDLTVSGTLTPNFTYEMQGGQLVKVDSSYVLDAEVTISPVVDMPAGLVAHISVQENLTFLNEETNGETEFHDVMKKMLPDASGTTLPAITDGSTETINESHTFVGEYRLPNDASDPIVHTMEHSVEEWTDLRLATWVQNPTTGEIWQSENAAVTVAEEVNNIETDTVDGQIVIVIDGVQYVQFGENYSPLGVNETPADLISVYPNPANDVINLSGVTGASTVSIYDAAGRLVSTTVVENNALNVSSLEAGVYNISIENNGVTKMEKVTIAH